MRPKNRRSPDHASQFSTDCCEPYLLSLSLSGDPHHESFPHHHQTPPLPQPSPSSSPSTNTNFIMRSDIGSLAIALGLVCCASAAPTFPCFDPPDADQTNPLGEGLEDVVEAECCEALVDER